MDQCRRCNELWRQRAVLLLELARLSQVVEREAAGGEPPAEMRDEFHRIGAEAAAVEAKIHIHAVLSHCEELSPRMPPFEPVLAVSVN